QVPVRHGHAAARPVVRPRHIHRRGPAGRPARRRLLRQRRPALRSHLTHRHQNLFGGPLALTTYRTALIGLSWIATDPAAPASHPSLGTGIAYSHAAALDNIPNVDVVGGCDIVPELRDQFLTRWQGRWPGAKVYTDYREMLDQERPELVCIATPDFLPADP